MKDEGHRMKDLLPSSLKYQGGAVSWPHPQSRCDLVFHPLSLIFHLLNSIVPAVCLRSAGQVHPPAPCRGYLSGGNTAPPPTPLSAPPAVSRTPRATASTPSQRICFFLSMYLWISYTIKDYPPQKKSSLSLRGQRPKQGVFTVLFAMLTRFRRISAEAFDTLENAPSASPISSL